MNKKILKNYFFNLIIVFTNIIFPMLLFPYASRILTPKNFGKFSFANSITSYFIILATLGISSYGIREISNLKLKKLQELKKGITEIFILTFISSLVSFFLFIFIVCSFKELKIEKNLFLIFSLQILFGFLTLDYFFIAMENHKRRTLRTLIIKTISLFFLFMFVRKPEDYNRFALIIILPEILAKLVDFYFIKKYLTFRYKVNLKKHFKAMIIIFFYLFSTTIYLNLDITMLGILKTTKEVGYYSIAIKMTKIVIPLITSFGVVLTPNIIKNISEKNEKRLFENLDYYIDFIIAFTLPIIIVLNFISKKLIFLFSGKEYLVAQTPMQIMLPIILFISLSGFCAAQILIPFRMEEKILKIAMLGLIMNIILNLLLIPKYSILGAAIATLISEFIVCLLRIWQVKRELKKYIFLKKYRINYFSASFILIAIGLYFEKKLLNFNYFIQIISITTILFLSYLTCLFFLKDRYLQLIILKIKKRGVFI